MSGISRRNRNQETACLRLDLLCLQVKCIPRTCGASIYLHPAVVNATCNQLTLQVIEGSLSLDGLLQTFEMNSFGGSRRIEMASNKSAADFTPAVKL